MRLSPTAFAFVSLLLAGCGPETISRDWHRLEPRIPAGDFTLPQLDGDAVTLSEQRGKVVIMEFWATWCGPCRYSTPSLDVIYKQYRDRGVTVLLINEGESADRVRAWAGQRFTAPILLDQAGEIGRLYHLRGIPRLFVIDQDGDIVYDHAGYRGGLEFNLKLILKELLEDNQVPGDA
jgi:thiol-disulfide isomerase/thioredoxin